MLNRTFLLGFLSGAVAGAAGYKLYEQNGGQLQNLIQGLGIPAPTTCDAIPTGVEPELAELLSQKERLEDLIAERNMTSDK